MSEKLEDKPDACDFCDFETELLVYCSHIVGDVQEGWLCDVCRGTLASNAYHYPKQYIDDSALMKQISYCTNLILSELKKKNKPRTNKISKNNKRSIT